MNQKQFRELCDGFGFEPFEIFADGEYCEGCCSIHKRPTKMYENAPRKNPIRIVMCRTAIIHFYSEDGVKSL